MLPPDCSCFFCCCCRGGGGGGCACLQRQLCCCPRAELLPAAPAAPAPAAPAAQPSVCSRHSCALASTCCSSSLSSLCAERCAALLRAASGTARLCSSCRLPAAEAELLLLWPQRQSQLQSQLPAPAPVPVPAPAPALAAAALPPPHGPCCSQSSSSSSVSGLAGSGGPLPWTLQLRLPALLLPELQPQAEFSSCLCSLCLLSSRARPQSLHSWASRPLRALP